MQGWLFMLKKHSNFTILPMYDSSDVWEGLFIELKNNSVVIGNIYRPPRDININYQTFDYQRINTHSICFRGT